ncbi:MAG TPA: PQQ-dependent dehydrogenase, methanol/ethanol family [Verrucomicrobiae bacterium]|jgi:alcohol dehydrogenase (cytochrome c)|nr:PQQ-dependent dehydrogenase, methanol/ethanol family [Verrucomicrobiae bacterium]
MKPTRRASILLLVASIFPLALEAQVTSDRLLHATNEPQNWLLYSGSYASQRYSQLKQIDPANVKNIELKWVFQAQSLQKFETTPLVVDGIMYLTQSPDDIVAVDAKSGRVFWIYHYATSPAARPCCGIVNRGLAILGDTLFMATVDAHLVAVDAKDGHAMWNVRLAEASAGYAATMAPLVVKGKVIVGVAGGEFGVRGFISAFDAETGKQAWKFDTIPDPDQLGHDSWRGADWEHGGGAVWMTGSYDPELNLTYWGTGNPGPDFNAEQRQGDNLYADSVLALDPDTGKMKWYFQFSPHDPYDYDSVQVPVLANADWQGSARKLMYWGNRNGFFYVLDRSTGKFLSGKPFVKVNWASGLDANGRPIATPQPPGVPTYPGIQGGTNWYSPSYSPSTGLFYLSTWEDYGTVFEGVKAEYKEGTRFTGGANASPIPGADNPAGTRTGPINTYTEALAHGGVVALDPATGEKRWHFDEHDVNTSGILTTASDLLFVGGREGYFQALNARTGALLWKQNLGGEIIAGPISFEVDGKQYVTIASGNSLFAFALRE